MKISQIILLNGASSSGKTSIAKLLQISLNDPFMIVSIDGFMSMYHERMTNPTTGEDFEQIKRVFPMLIDGFHRSITALAEAGNNLIVDHVLQEDEWLKQCVLEWVDLDVLFVGVKCPLAVLLKREESRQDRVVGTAEYQFLKVHAQAVYDLELDTSLLSSKQCVEKIIHMLEFPPPKPAFKILAERFKF
jgi:chloramphenicol 3-O phosphotransferase